MTITQCITLPDPEPPPAIKIPSFGIIQAARKNLYELPDFSEYIFSMQDAAGLALAPLRRWLEMIEVMLAIKDCIGAVPESIFPPNPKKMIDCIKNLAKAFGFLLEFVPPFSYIPCGLSLLNYAIQVIDEILDLFQFVDDEISDVRSAIADSLRLGDIELGDIFNCATATTKPLILQAKTLIFAIQPIVNSMIEPLIERLPNEKLQEHYRESADLYKQIGLAAQILDVPGTNIINDAVVAPLTELAEEAEFRTGEVLEQIENAEVEGSLPVLEDVLQALVALRNILVLVYNTLAPIIGEEASKAPIPIPDYKNF